MAVGSSFCRHARRRVSGQQSPISSPISPSRPASLVAASGDWRPIFLFLLSSLITFLYIALAGKADQASATAMSIIIIFIVTALDHRKEGDGGDDCSPGAANIG